MNGIWKLAAVPMSVQTTKTYDTNDTHFPASVNLNNKLEKLFRYQNTLHRRYKCKQRTWMYIFETPITASEKKDQKRKSAAKSKSYPVSQTLS